MQISYPQVDIGNFYGEGYNKHIHHNKGRYSAQIYAMQKRFRKIISNKNNILYEKI